MTRKRLPVVLNAQGARTPTRAHQGDAGLDLYLDTPSPTEIWFGEVVTVNTGIRIAVPDNHAGLILPRSGLAKQGVTIVNAPGLIDSGYRGEIMVTLTKLVNDELPTVVAYGDRIAQLLIVPFTYLLPSLYWSLPQPSDARGEGGFGSTGK